MIAFFDLPSGLSGDMFLGCLVSAGWTIDDLRAGIERLHLIESWSVEARSVMKVSMAATQVTVTTSESHHQRRLQDVRQIIDSAELPPAVRQQSMAVFGRLAEAEAMVHGTSVDDVHFHEVGALDAIIDVVGSVLGLTSLGIERLYASPPPVGGGWVHTEHGQLPLPAPATLHLLAGAGAPTRQAPGPGEWLTPTAAALLTELADFQQPAMRLQRIGTGAGQRQCDWPNVARLWVGQPLDDGPMVQIETNIDDMNPQLYESVNERLFAAGARDVWLTPVQMKKGRPAVVLSLLTPASKETELVDLLLRETTTLGVRVRSVRRHEAQRQQCQVQTVHGVVGVKLKWVDGDLVGAMPEYDDCRSLAQRVGVPLRNVFDLATAAAQGLLAEKSP